ncbi:LLM class flavin-dependent oxidoreductase [Streptomyces malaysiensis subsp. malaysiensis]
MGRRACRGNREALREPHAPGGRRRWHRRYRRGREGDTRPRAADTRALHRRHGRPRQELFNDLVRRYGYEAEAEEIQDLYLDGKKKEAEAKVPFQLLEQVNLVGPASYVRERIEAFRESGVTNLQVTPTGDDPAGLVRQLKEWMA